LVAFLGTQLSTVFLSVPADCLLWILLLYQNDIMGTDVEKFPSNAQHY